MRQIAIITDGAIENIIDTGPDGWPNGVDISDITPAPQIGWSYQNGAFSPPPEPAPELPPQRIITNLAFDKRFTLDERVEVEMASLDDPTAPIEMRRQSAFLRVSLERAKKAAWTDLDDPVTRSSVSQLETMGLLAQGRGSEILDAPVQDWERP